jgi:hypothetical protein
METEAALFKWILKFSAVIFLIMIVGWGVPRWRTKCDDMLERQRVAAMRRSEQSQMAAIRNGHGPGDLRDRASYGAPPPIPGMPTLTIPRASRGPK